MVLEIDRTCTLAVSDKLDSGLVGMIDWYAEYMIECPVYLLIYMEHEE